MAALSPRSSKLTLKLLGDKKARDDHNGLQVRFVRLDWLLESRHQLSIAMKSWKHVQNIYIYSP